MPRPAWGPFVADTTPPLLHLGFPRARHGYRHLLRMYGAQPGRVDQRKRGVFLFEVAPSGVRPAPEPPRCIAEPTGIAAQGKARGLHRGPAAAVAVGEEKTALDTRGVLAQIALDAPVCLAVFDHLLTVPRRVLNRDACPGPLLPAGHCQDEAQCDIHLRTSRSHSVS